MKSYKVLLFFLLLFVSSAVNADDFDGISYRWISHLNGYYVTTKSDGLYSGNINIPETVNNKKVCGIYEEAFKDCVDLEEVSIPKSVVTIEHNAFSGCVKLRNVNIPEDSELNSCGYRGWFYGCKSLKSIYIPASQIDIGSSCFEGCEKLEKVVFANGIKLKSIGSNAFKNCKNLKSIDLSQVVSYSNKSHIGSEAFSGTGLTSIIIPNGFTDIYESFIGCSDLISVDLPTSMESIRGAFKNCISLSEIDIPYGVTDISGAFEGCSSLVRVNIPESVTNIKNAFAHCTSLPEVNIPNSVVGNIDHTFDNCISLTKINLPENIETIGFASFRNCPKLSSVIIPNGVKTIGQYAFEDCNLLSLIVGSGVISIHSDAFADCNIKELTVLCSKVDDWFCRHAIEKLIIGNGVESIKKKSFEECGLSEIIFHEGSSLSEIPEGVFRKNAIITVHIPYSIKTIGLSSFSECTKLEKVIFPNNSILVKIDEYAFEKCESLKKIELPDLLESIGSDSFNGCVALDTLKLPKILNEIGNRAFYNCSALKAVFANMPEPFKIDEYVFSDKTYKNATLHTNGVADKYRETFAWSKFFHIVNFGETISDGDGGNDSGNHGNNNGVNDNENGNGNEGDENGDQGNNDQNVDLNENIVFEDGNVKAICIENWDTGNDGELSKAEAAAVTSLGEVFRNSEITTFDELQYFTGLTKLDDNAFTYCKSLTAITIPANVTTIGESVFAGCEKLTGLKVAEGNTSFGMNEGVLYNKDFTSLIFCPVAKTGTVTVNSKTTTIRENAFYNCTQLTGISLPSSLTTISSAAFVGCSSLTTIAIPANVSSIGMGCFTGCTALKSITVDTGNSAYSASDGVLVEHQTKLMAYPNAKGDTYAVGEGVTTIDGYAFCMTGIKSLTLPSTLKTISDYAISYCSNLTTITSYATVPPIVSATAFSEGTFSGAMLNVPIGCKESYSTTDVWKNFSNIVEIGKDGSEFITIGKSGKASYCGDKSLDFSFSDEIKAYIATGFDKDEGTIWLTRVKDVPAGVPVLIKGEANKTYDVPVTNSQNSYYTNMFVGNTIGEKMVIQETDGDMVNYYLSGDGTFKSVNKTANIGTNKCYLQLPGTFEAAATGAAQTVKIGSIGKASFAAPVDLDFTNVSGLKAFTATGYDKSTKTIWLTRVMKVQKGEGVLLKGDPNSYEIPSVAVQSRYENMFIGNTSGNEIQVLETSEDGSQTNYYLSGKDGSFVSVSGYAKIGDNKCYLALPTSMVAVSSTRSAEDDYKFEEPEVIKLPIDFKSIGSEGDGTTGVKEVKSGEAKGDEWYTLQGQRVAKPGKGVYIHNGHKVVIRSTTK